MKQLKHATLAGAAVFAGFTAAAWDLDLGSQKVQFHGFASQGLLYSGDYNYIGKTTDGSVEFNEFGLNASISPFNRTRITAQAFTFDAGNVGNYELLLDYASIEYTFSDYIGVRAGRVRRPGGIYNHIQDVDLARTSVLLPQGMYDTRWRDFSTSLDGGLVFGSIPLGKGGSLAYEAYAGYLNLSRQGGVARVIENGLPPAPFGALTKLDKDLIAGTQVWWNTPVDGLRAGVSVGQVFDFAYDIYVSPLVGGPGTLHSESTIPFQQYSLEYLWKSWTFQAEYYTYNSISHNYLGNTSGPIVSRSRNRPDSWYVSAAYRFNKWFEVGSYYTEYYADAKDRDGSTLASPSDGSQKDTALSLRFDLTDWWIFKLEGHYIHGTALLENDALNPVRRANDWLMFAAKTTFSF